MSWITKNANETDAAFVTRLGTMLAEVPVQKHSASSVAYSANGLVLRQVETVTVTEYRALAKSAADALASLGSDDTTTTVYYHQIGSSADYAAVAVTTGTRTTYSAGRGNEADGWRVTKTVQEFAAGSATGWTTTRPSSAAATGIVVSSDSSASVASRFDNHNLVLTENVTVTEYRYLTQAEAAAKVASETAAGIAMHTYGYDYTVSPPGLPSYTATAYAYAQSGTDKSASSRYVDAENGYTVSVTARTLAAAGTGWRFVS